MERSLSVQAYEANLQTRLQELREGDQAYKLHEAALMEAFDYAMRLHGGKSPQRILDAGCGLGYTSAFLTKLGQEVVGIDVSEKAISLAKNEHKNTDFYASSIEAFSKKMKDLGIEKFDQAVLNMVIHSVNDKIATGILNGIRKCLKPEGTVLIITPTKEWLIQKLIEYAQDQEMDRDTVGIPWIKNKLCNQKVELPVKIRSGEYYPEPITVYNRSKKEYEKLLQACRFGVRKQLFAGETNKLVRDQLLPFIEMDDYIANMELEMRGRRLLISFALPK